jgi:hypothetical protein
MALDNKDNQLYDAQPDVVALFDHSDIYDVWDISFHGEVFSITTSVFYINISIAAGILLLRESC